MIRVGRGVSGLTMDRVTFGPCPSGSGWIGCASGQLFLTTTTLNGLPPKNIVVKNSRFHGAVNFHVQTNQNVGTSNVNWTFAYNTFGAHEPLALNGAHTGISFVGNVGTRMQTCQSGLTYTKNVWQWSQGTPCGSDKRVTGNSYSTDQLGFNTDLTLKAGSPAIDGGEAAGSGFCASSLGGIDFDRNQRPLGAACDAGSDERQ
jgi:hypothetical protein